MLFCLHGLAVECSAPTAELESQLVRPFSLYLADKGTANVIIEIVENTPPYDQLPTMEVSYNTPRNVVYDTKDLRVVDYFGKGAVLEDKVRQTFTIYGVDRNFLQEAFYLLVLSIFGQHCDKTGLLRIHAMALSYEDKAILMPMPQGGGKSTMAFAMLKEEGFRLISDDEPIASPEGSILPFALRIGTLDKAKIRDIPAEFVYSIDRMEFGLKHFIDVRYWEPQLEFRALNDIVYVTTRRVLNGPAAIRPIPKYRVVKSLLRDAIIGVGLYQGLEFLLSHSIWSTVSKVGTVFKRSFSAWKMLRGARTYQMTLTRDIDENRRLFSEFVRELDKASE
jgi:hypothetical protein